MRSLALLLLAVVAALPRPPEVEPAPDPPAGALTVAPAVATVTVAPGEVAEPALRIANGGDDPLVLDLAITGVAIGDDGAPAPGDGAGPAGAWIALGADRIHLAPGERALVWPAIAVPADAAPGGYAAALVATAATEPPVEVAALFLIAVPGAAQPALEAAVRLEVDGRDATTTVALHNPGPYHVVAEGRLRVTAWGTRTLLEEDVPATVVLAGTERAREIRFRPALVPGPHRADLILAVGDDVHRAETSAWLWHLPALALVAGLVFLLAVAVLLGAMRRRS